MLTVILAFIVLGFILYGNCLRGAVLLDDAYIYAQKQYLIEGNWKAALKAPWRRLTLFSYALNGKLSGQDTYSFHVVNVCIHIVNALLTILIFRALGFGGSWPVVGGFLFLVHPLATAAAAYISGRPSLLSAFFVFLSILAVLHGWPVLAFPLMLGAVSSKEDTVSSTLLLAVLAGGWWAIAFLTIPVAGYIAQRKQLYGIWRKEHRLPQPDYSITAITQYLIRLPQWFIGESLNNKPHLKPWTWSHVFAALIVAIVIVSSAAVGSASWLTLLAMTLLSPMLVYMVVPIEDPIMDYRGYVGLLGMVGISLAILETYSIPLGIAFVVYSFIRAFPRVLHFRSPLTFWVGCMDDGSKESPFVVAQLGMAFSFIACGEVQKESRDVAMKSAEHWLKQAVRLDPSHSGAWNNLVMIYSLQDKNTECMETLERWTVACPKQRRSWEVLRLGYMRLKDQANIERCDQMLAIL